MYVFFAVKTTFIWPKLQNRQQADYVDEENVYSSVGKLHIVVKEWNATFYLSFSLHFDSCSFWQQSTWT